MSESKTLKAILDEKIKSDIPTLIQSQLARREEIEINKEDIKNNYLNAVGYDITTLMGDTLFDYTVEIGYGAYIDISGIFKMTIYSSRDLNGNRVFNLNDAHTHFSNSGYGISAHGNELNDNWDDSEYSKAANHLKNAYLIAEWLTKDHIEALFNIITKHTTDYLNEVDAISNEYFELGKKMEARILTYVEYNLKSQYEFGMDVTPIVPTKDQNRLHVRWYPKFNKMTKKNVSITYVADGYQNVIKSANIKVADWNETIMKYLISPFVNSNRLY